MVPTAFLIISACSYELSPLQIHRAWGKYRTIWGSSFILSKKSQSVALGFLCSVGYRKTICMSYLENLRELLWSLFLAGFRIVQTEHVGLWGRTKRPWAYLPVSLTHRVLLLFSVFCLPVVAHLGQVPNYFLILFLLSVFVLLIASSKTRITDKVIRQCIRAMCGSIQL